MFSFSNIILELSLIALSLVITFIYGTFFTKVIADNEIIGTTLWSRAMTITGLIVAYLNGYLHQAMTLDIGSGFGKNTAIGIGMWLGIIMAYNVWFVIWPNQKKALGIIESSPEEKANSAKTAMLFSNANFTISY